MAGFIRSGFMRLCLAFAIIAIITATPVRTGSALGSDDRQAIKQVIQAQIDAFRSDDAAKAFGFAAPSTQERFGNAGQFIAMVKRGYLPVYRPREIEFSELLTIRGQPTQQVIVTGPESDVYNAYYMMEKQQSGAWRITGCFLRQINDRAI